MNKTMKPIFSEADLDEAIAAGAVIEFTMCGPAMFPTNPDTYDMPPLDGGWIHPLDDYSGDNWALARMRLNNPDGARMFRAFYAEAEAQVQP